MFGLTGLLALVLQADPDALPPGAVLRLGETRLRHPLGLRTLVFSPDGTRLLSSGLSAELWDSATGSRVTSWNPGGDVAAFSRDGTRIVVAMSELRFVEVATGQTTAGPPLEGVSSKALSFDASGKSLIVLHARGLSIYDPASKERGVLVTETAVMKGALSLDGRRALLVEATSAVSLWDMTNRVRVGDAIIKGGHWTSVTLDARGERAALGANQGVVRVLDTASGRILRELNGPKNASVFALALSPDGLLVAAAIGTTLQVWNVADGKLVLTFNRRGAAMEAVTFSPDGKRLATGDELGRLRIWDVVLGKELVTPTGHDGAVRGSALSGDGSKAATVGADGTVRIWDQATGREVRVIDMPGVSGLAFSPDSKKLAIASLSEIRLMGLAEEGGLSSRSVGAIRLAFSSDGRRLLATGMRRSLLDTDDLKEIRVFKGASGPLHGALSINGERIVLGWKEGVAIWTGDPDREPMILEKKNKQVATFSLLPDDRTLAALVTTREPDHTEIVLWNVDTGAEIGSIPAPGASALAVSPVGSALAWGGGGSLHIWDLEPLRERRVWTGAQRIPMTLTFSRDGRRLLSGGTGTPLLWDLSK